MIGKVIGNRYEIIEKVGGGGMAEVYKARCRLLNRYVAVKVLRDQFKNDADVLTKFKREAQSAASLSHPNIVNVYDVGEEDGKNYIVMEYINGKTLKDLIRIYGHLDTKETVSTAISIAEALEAAHKNGIVHRDIKPHNIMVTEDRIIKVTDFGIARATSSVTMTNNGGVLGSAHYLSPEQARGGMVDKRSDIYSLGVVMYEMATGKVPFDADSPISVAIMHIQEDALPPKEVNSDIPRELDFIIMKAMKKNPSERYQDVKALLSDLKSYQKDGTLASSENDADEIDSRTQIIPPINEDMINTRNKMVQERSKQEEKINKQKKAEEEKAARKKEKEEKRKAKIAAREKARQEKLKAKEEAKEQNAEQEKKEKKEKKPKKEGESKKTTVYAILLALLTVVIASGIYLASDGSLFQKEISAPPIVGFTVEDAQKLVAGDGVKIKVDGEEYNDEQEAGKIITQNVPATTKLKKGDVIGVIVSKGPQPVKVPNVAGMDLESARTALSDAGLVLGSQKEEYNDEIEEGLIISQDPAPDAEVKKSTEINVVVSKGREIFYTKVPNLVGLNVTQAISQANTFKLIVGNVSYAENSEKSGTVIYQSLNSGEDVEQGTTIDMTVSSGPKEEPKEEKPENSSSGKSISITANNITKKPVNVTVYKVKNGARSEVYSASGVDATSGSVTVNFNDSGTGTVVYELYVDGIPQVSKTVNY